MVGGLIAFRPVAKQKHNGGRVWQSKAAHLKAARKQTEVTGRVQGKELFFKGTPSPHSD
jgi:hypothetical protein